jgi:wyosine [tRNA(Phe)-imidazoG37] synthetase (radical SAM superfamily)
MSLAFGPIHSRRFGRSLGINHIPHKTCTYSCVYCQLGPTHRTSIERRHFCETSAIVEDVRAVRQSYDVISFVPDGEPTVDADLGTHIRAVKQFGVPVAVITNGSLLWNEDVRRDLDAADIVSIEIDAVDEWMWRRIDRPSSALASEVVLNGIRTFARERRSKLWTQTMLLDDFDDLENVAQFIAEIGPDRVCISIPTRPPGGGSVRGADGVRLARALELIPNAEMMTHEPGSALVTTTEELLDVLAVHPLREDRIDPALIDDQRIKRVVHSGTTFLALRGPRRV